MNKPILILLVVLLMVSCNSQGQNNNKDPENKEVKSEPWKLENYIDSVQILLTNEYKLDDSFGFGASSFIIKSGVDTYLCTAKHLLGEAMGISPEIKTSRFNSSLEYWNAYPRNGKIANDTISVSKLITEKQNDIDIILFECQLEKNNAITALTPRFSKPKRKEKFEIIGCEYSDSECHQRRYYATMDSYEDGKILLKSEVNFTPSGFSGAPVIDSRGLVIGLLSGGGEFEGELYLAIEPISKVEKYLK